MSEQLIPTPGVFGENGNFLLERELGAGGMGGVYMGRDKMLDRPVAVKVMLKEMGDDPEFVEKFKQEAQSAARLIHPNIAQIYSYGICNGMPYMAMELASGGSLYSIMNANPGKTDVARVIKICQQVAQALQCASDQGFVHGDVKPENILLDANGNAKLVDFGLAAMQKETNEIWGTPYYISPEKVKKEPVDFRSDMYSLGGTLYHALTGVAPFEGEDSIAVVKKRFEGDPKKPSEIRPELTPAIDALVMKMLARDREGRYPSFEALLEAFKEVLTSGLTAKPAAAGGSAAGRKPMATGTRRLTTVRGRRMAMTRRPADLAKPPAEGEGSDEAAHAKGTSAAEEDEEESGGNLGLKVVGVVVGVILLVAAVIGGLVWYQVADRKARAAEEQAQIGSGIGRARAAIADTLASAAKFADEFDAFAARAVAECQKPTDELAKILPPEQSALLKPGPTPELLAAIASTNAVAAPVVATNAPAAVATTNAPAATAAATNAAASASGAAAKPAVGQSGAAPAAADAAKKAVEQTPAVVLTMNDLWSRAYGCQACAIRIRVAVRKLLAHGAEADAYRGSTRECMEKLAELSRALVEEFEGIKASKDVETVRKGIAFIRTKGEKTVEQTLKQIRLDKLKKAREEKAAAVAAAEEERKKKQAEERQAKVEEEQAAARAKFEALVAQGSVRQLDWKSAIRQLEALKGEMTTAEGQLAADLELRKVAAMRKMQEVLIRAMKGYAFKKGKLKGMRVTAVSDREIQVENGKNRHKLTWQKFASGHYSNLIEVLNQFVFNGRKNIRLSQREAADVLTGGALFLGIVCAEEASAANLSEKLARESVKQFPEYQAVAQKIFPEFFQDADETAEKE
ncbi:MAG: protein kinase [Kiritimatiellia bacterium]